MAIDRLRVVPRYEAKGMIAAALLLGSLAGVAGRAIMTIAFQIVISRLEQAGATSTYLIVLLPLVVVGLSLSPAVAFGVLVGAICQRRMPVFVLGATFWGAMFLAYVLADGVFEADANSWLASWDVARVVLWTIAFGLVGGLFQLGVCWFIRAMVFVVVEQDGLTCWRCGYPAGSERIARCPECGTTIDPKRYRTQWLHGAVSVLRWRSRVAGGVLWVVGLAALAPGFIREGIPTARFLRQSAAWGELSGGIMILPTAGASLPTKPTVGAVLALDATAGEFVKVLYLPSDPTGLPAMQLQVQALTYSSGGVNEFDWGNPRILCDLTRAQAEYSVRHGVPPALLEAIRQAAAAAGFSTVGMPLAIQKPDLWVDAAPFFPAP